MKKLVLIPHERYDQFLSRESKEHSVQPESIEEKQPEPKTSEKAQDERVENLIEEETPLNSQTPESSVPTGAMPPLLPPPPGEPALTLQTREGASQKAKRQKESTNRSWRQTWKAF